MTDDQTSEGISLGTMLEAKRRMESNHGLSDALRYVSIDSGQSQSLAQQWERQYAAQYDHSYNTHSFSLISILRMLDHGAQTALFPLPNGDRISIEDDTNGVLRGYIHNRSVATLPQEVDTGNMNTENLVNLRLKIKKELYKRGEL